jgi:hypothetical protein
MTAVQIERPAASPTGSVSPPIGRVCSPGRTGLIA